MYLKSISLSPFSDCFYIDHLSVILPDKIKRNTSPTFVLSHFGYLPSQPQSYSFNSRHYTQESVQIQKFLNVTVYSLSFFLDPNARLMILFSDTFKSHVLNSNMKVEIV